MRLLNLSSSPARLLIAGVCAAALLCTSTGALAQGGGGGGMRGGGGGMGMMFGGGFGGGGGMETPVTKTEVERYAKLLAFTPEQSEAAKMLLEGLDASFKPKADAARKLMEDTREEFRETRDPGVWQSMGEKMGKMREERAAAEKQFMEDVKSLLTPAQSAEWPRVERDRRRDRTMRQGLMSGERADLIRLVEQLKLSEEATKAVAPVLGTYETDLDLALVKRNELTERATGQATRLRDAFMGGDMTEVNKLFEELREASTKVRDTNRRYAKQIEGVLTGEEQTKFATEFRRESYPQIYRTTRHGTRVLDAAAAFELDATAKSSLAALKAEYDQKGQTLAEQAEKAQDEQEETMTVQGMMGMRDNDEMRKVRDARRELESKTIEQVKALLSLEQVAKLPERGSEAQNQGGDEGGQRRRGQGAGQGAGGGTPPAPR